MMGFKFNDKHSSEFGIVMRTVKPPIPPKVRYKEVKVIGRNGTIKFPDGYEDGTIVLEIAILGNLNVRRAKIRAIEQWLNAGYKTLKLDYDELEYTALLRNIEPKDFSPNSETFEITFSFAV